MPFYKYRPEATSMSVPCEVAVKCVLPVVRALVAKQLMADHGLKQVEAAKLLSVSQPAISLYCRDIRGKAIDLEDDPDVKRLVTKMSEALAKGSYSYRDLTAMYCRMCRTIRAKGLLCKLHKAFDPLVDIDKCELCVVSRSVKCF
jgi:predicted transcriptional regulator